ncbi:MAG: hypothetical protein WA151_18855 [Desulfatirhabdiaceae bacterium]
MNFLNKILANRSIQQERLAKKRMMNSQELVKFILDDIEKNAKPVSEIDAKLVLVDMDFEDVEKSIFETDCLDAVEFDKGHMSVVTTGYPFMDQVSTLTEKRLGMRGIHAMK